jgi:hypothetical protein
MPTYRNDSSVKSFNITNIYGILQNVKPADTIETYEQDLPSDLTLTSAAPIGASVGNEVVTGYTYDLTSGQAPVFTKIFECNSRWKYIKAHSHNGSGQYPISETLTIKNSSLLGSNYNTKLKEYAFAGSSSDYFWEIDAEMIYMKGEGLIVELTNANHLGKIDVSIGYTRKG